MSGNLKTCMNHRCFTGSLQLPNVLPSLSVSAHEEGVLCIWTDRGPGNIILTAALAERIVPRHMCTAKHGVPMYALLCRRWPLQGAWRTYARCWLS